MSKIEEQCKELEIDERDLAEKIRKKSQDLEQSQKRLKSLKNVRPAFMDEYEKLEMELQDHYNVYLERFRNLHYLQKELEMCEKEESDKLRYASRTLKSMQKKLWDEELRILHGEADDSEVSIGENVYQQQ